MSVVKFCLNDEAETLLKEAIYAVEATAYERHTICAKFQIEELMRGGGMTSVGELAGYPVNVEVWYGRHQGRVILFYFACSRVVDHDMVTAWLDKQGFTGPRGRADATNFHPNHIDASPKLTAA